MAERGAYKRFVSDPLQAAGAYLLVGGLRLLRPETASDLGGRLGRWIGPRVGLTKGARRNLRLALPGLTEAEVETIVGDMWENLGRTLFEYPHLDRLRCTGDGAEIEVVGLHHIERLVAEGRGGILFSGHLGNWEVLNIAARQAGLDMHFFYRAPNNPLVERLFRRHRPGKGEQLAKGARGAKRALGLLKKKEILAMLVDQRMNDGIAVPLFGRAAMTAPALAQFALRFRCPVLPARAERLGGLRFRVTVLPPLEIAETGDHPADVKALMTRVNEQLEAWIRATPAQWLWVHKRWPVDAEPTPK